MTADCPDDFPYKRVSRKVDAGDCRACWDVAMGLQRVDGLSVSDYLRSLADGNVSGEFDLDAARRMLRTYYSQRKGETTADAVASCNQAAVDSGVDSGFDLRAEEADLVSVRIVELLQENAFAFTPGMLSAIHERLFQEIDDDAYRPGKYKMEALQKREVVLNGDSVLYCDPSLIAQSLAFVFGEEADAYYAPDFDADQLDRFARFVSRVWQVHPFAEGNTRTVAVFVILYLRYLGFDADNEPFKRHSAYFRDSLVRANYRNAKAGVMPDRTYLVRFFGNMLCGMENDLRSRDLMVQRLYDDPSLLRNVPPEEALSR